MIPLFKVYMSDKVFEPLKEVLQSGYIGQGSKVDEFEERLKEYFNNDYILTMNSATASEHLALHLLKKPFKEWRGIQTGDEVLATPLTCTATNWPILANGFKLKWVDVDPNTMNMDLVDLERKITPTTKAIMFVHWGGYPIDLDKVRDIQTRTFEMYGFKPAVIEDCAHAMGSTYKGKPIGSHGNICTFSLQAIKHITAVDGGILSVPHSELYNRGKLLRWYGIDRETNRKDFRCEADVEEWGFKFHMNDVNATIGMENFKEMSKIVGLHQSNAQYYNDNLSNVQGVTLLENSPDRKSASWLYTMKVERRDDFMNAIKEAGIMVSRVHERNDKHTCAKEFRCHLPNLEKVVREMICIPVGWWVSEKDREYIVDCIKKGW